MRADYDEPLAQRAISLGAVILLHAALFAVLLTQSATVRAFLPTITIAHIIQPPAPPPAPPPVKLDLQQALLPIPVPEVEIAPPPATSSAPRATQRISPAGPPASHFGAATDDAGFGVQVATATGGGAKSRGNLGEFQAAVKRAVLARKVQPTLAWDRRNTCTINYAVTITRTGAVAHVNIDPCAIPEINQAALQAVQNAAPFPQPPDLGASTTTVHGTLIFHP